MQMIWRATQRNTSEKDWDNLRKSFLKMWQKREFMRRAPRALASIPEEASSERGGAHSKTPMMES